MPKQKKEPEKRLNVKLPESEHALWFALAADRGVTVSALVRRAMAGNAKTRPPAVPKKQRVYKSVDPALLAALARIGNNLNQLARVANQKGDLPTLVQLASIEREIKGWRDAC